MDTSNKVILTVACTGAWPQKSDTPYIPLTPQEEADEIVRCADAGASIAHIHVRDDAFKASIKALISLLKRCDWCVRAAISS